MRKLARRSDVAAIYGPEQYGPHADDAGTTERVNPVWALGNLGQLAGNVRPVVHEGEGVADFNPLLSNATHPVIYWCSAAASYCPSGKNIADHPTVVGGEIAATHPLYRGIAPSVQTILSANVGAYTSANFDAQAVNAFEWATGNGGDPINMSWGTFCGGFQTFFSRYVDWAIKNLGRTVVIAAGNHPSGCGNATDDEKVAAPGGGLGCAGRRKPGRQQHRLLERRRDGWRAPTGGTRTSRPTWRSPKSPPPGATSHRPMHKAATASVSARTRNEHGRSAGRR